MQKQIMLAAMCVLGCVLGAGAQTTSTGSSATTSTAATSTAATSATSATNGKASFTSANDALLSVFEQQVMAVAKAMPAEKYDFTPASLNIPGAKFDGVRTFAGEAKHLAQANFFFYGTAGVTKPTADVKAIGALKGKDEIVSALAQSFTFAHTALANLTPDNQNDPVDVDGIKTKGTLAAFAAAHGYDHYGQMVEYLRLNGITPPGSK